MHQFQPSPRLLSVPQFPGVRAACSSSLHGGSGAPLRTGPPTSFGPDLPVFGKSYIFILAHFPIPRAEAAIELRTYGALVVVRMSSWPSRWTAKRSACNRSAGNGSAPALEGGAVAPSGYRNVPCPFCGAPPGGGVDGDGAMAPHLEPNCSSTL